MNRLFYNCTDPHAVYYRLIPKLEDNDFYIVRRGLVSQSSDFYLLRIALVFLGDFIAIVELFVTSKRKILVLEFSGFSYVLFYPFFHFLKGKQIHLNVNHNFNSAVEYRLIKILSSIFNITFFEPAHEVLSRFRFITPLYFSRVRLQEQSIYVRNVHVFTGQRLEQRHIHLEQFCGYLSSLDLNVNFYGQFTNTFLSAIDYQSLFTSDNMIIVLYNMDNYQLRHSGVVLESIVNQTLCLVPKIGITEYYEEKFSFVYTYNSFDDFCSKINKILIRHIYDH
jgi:hypothetical protein